MTLSERPKLNAPAPRTARVWQPLDLLHPSAGHGGFVRKAWSDRPLQSFDLQVIKTWSPPDEETDEEAGDASLADAAPLTEAEEPEVDLAAATLALTEDALEAVRQTAYAEGLAQGQREVREEWNAEKKLKESSSQNILRDLETAVRRLINTPAELYEPMKRLALHLAEQLVLAELTISPQAIERLVRRSVDELSPQRLAPITVELNPADLAVLQPHGAEQGSASAAGGDKTKNAKPDWPWHLQANSALLPGSVRASASDAVVSDFVEHRLDALARSLLLDTDKRTSQSAFNPTSLAARRASEQVVDAQPRMSAAPESHRSFESDLPDDAAPPMEASDAAEDDFSEPFTWNPSDEAGTSPSSDEPNTFDGPVSPDPTEPRDA
jgi:flagellar biosynthesis/type III secretory pathway protein FliH